MRLILELILHWNGQFQASMNILLFFTFLILFADFLGALIFVGPNLPIGYEDERGFHFGSDSGLCGVEPAGSSDRAEPGFRRQWIESV